MQSILVKLFKYVGLILFGTNVNTPHLAWKFMFFQQQINHPIDWLKQIDVVVFIFVCTPNHGVLLQFKSICVDETAVQAVHNEKTLSTADFM